MRILPSIVLLCLAGPALAEEVKFDFRGGKFDEQLLAYDGPDQAGMLIPEAEGLRVRFTPDRFPPRGMGAVWRFQVKGDFVATGRYEILRVDQPERGGNIGVELYVMLHGPSRDGVSWCRVLRDGPSLSLTHLATNDMNQRGVKTNLVRPTTARSERGRLRLARVGPTMIASLAEGDDEEFQEIFRSEVGTAQVSTVRFGGIPGGDRNAQLDARLLDVELKGDELTQAGKAPRPIPVADGVAVAPPLGPSAPEAAPARDRRWLYWGLAVFVLILLALLPLLLVRRRQPEPKKPASAKPKPAPSRELPRSRER